MVPAGQILLASFFAGAISIDRAAFGQFQLSRPMVAAPILGLLMGCPTEGVIIGLLFELLFLDSLPVGSFVPLEPLFPALLSVVLIGTGQIPPQALPIALLLSLPSVLADRYADRRWRRSNKKIFDRAQVYVRLGRVDLAQIQMGLAILHSGFFHFLAFLFSCAVLVPLGGLVAGKTVGFSGLLLATALAPFLTGLAALSSNRLRKKGGWIGFATGLFFGLLLGVA